MANHISPGWFERFKASGIRRLLENPERVVGPYIKAGMTVLDVGCGLGFFTLPMARLVGPGGKVVAVDTQVRMIAGLMRRVEKAGLEERVIPRLCGVTSLELAAYRESIDVVLAFAVVHEVPDQMRFFAQLSSVVAHRGKIIVAEAPGQVSVHDFKVILETASKSGFKVIESMPMRGKKDRAAVLQLQSP